MSENLKINPIQESFKIQELINENARLNGELSLTMSKLNQSKGMTQNLIIQLTDLHGELEVLREINNFAKNMNENKENITPDSNEEINEPISPQDIKETTAE